MAAKEINPETSVRTINGKTLTLVEWAAELQISQVALYNRLAAVDDEGNKTWSVRDAHTVPPRRGLTHKSDKIARPHRFRLEYKGKLISTHYRRGHADTALTEDGRKGLKIVELEKVVTSASAGLRLAETDKMEIMQGAADAKMSFSVFLVTAALDATRAGTYRA